METSQLEETLADAVLNRPQEFFIGEKRYELHSPTLGMSILIDRLIKVLDINANSLTKNSGFESLKICIENKETVCSILAIYSLFEFEKIIDSRCRREREEELKSLEIDELAKLFLYVLTSPKAETLISQSGIIKEQQAQAKIAKIKNKDGHSQTFGGKTLYGILIDTACAKYGWTKEYVVWGIDLISLRMMLADAVNSVYLSDDEIKKLGISHSGEKVIMISTQEDVDRIKKSYSWD